MSSSIDATEACERISKALGIPLERLIKACNNDYIPCTWLLKRGDKKGNVCGRMTEEGHVFCKQHISNARSESAVITIIPGKSEHIPSISSVTGENYGRVINDIFNGPIKVGQRRYLPSIGLVALSKDGTTSTIHLIEGDVDVFHSSMRVIEERQ